MFVTVSSIEREWIATSFASCARPHTHEAARHACESCTSAHTRSAARAHTAHDHTLSSGSVGRGCDGAVCPRVRPVIGLCAHACAL
eukprot:918023-Prymnesium_polylepis.1